ncbi:hypothetical protein JHS3_23590 [Jeongeupia sp. HS-3]|nr:hypothetical protein JHS3_23590 [Jeongeupia sp. HS-3]
MKRTERLACQNLLKCKSGIGTLAQSKQVGGDGQRRLHAQRLIARQRGKLGCVLIEAQGQRRIPVFSADGGERQPECGGDPGLPAGERAIQRAKPGFDRLRQQRFELEAGTKQQADFAELFGSG